MRGGHVIAISLCACGRVGFGTAAEGDSGGDDAVSIDARIDANVCLDQTADIASWPMPNDRIGLPRQRSLTVAGERVVDNITGLEWQRTVEPGAMTWADAVTYCANLQLDGGCWRLPERIELASVINYSVHTPASPTELPAPVSEYWTNTTFMPAPANRWVVRFDVGSLVDRDATGSSLVRCVRGAQELSSVRFDTSTPGVVVDRNTGLEWQRDVVGSYQWAEAQDYCSMLGTDGGGWRSPSIQELETIVDTSVNSGRAIDEIAFPGTPPSMFWSGNEIQNDASQGWTIDFTAGYSFRPITSNLPTRCVR